MHNFQINALIRYLTSSTCFEPHGFIIRVCLIFTVPPARLLTKLHNKTYHTKSTRTNRIPDDEPVMFETCTCRRRQNSN